MTKEEFKTLTKGLKSVYASQNFLPDDDSMKIWYRLLRDLPYEVAAAAAQRHMMTNRFPPTVADIREQSVKVADKDSKDWLEGWSQVSKVMSRFGYNRPKEAIEALTAFDERTGRVVEMLGWQNLCMSENPTADRANFRQAYENMQMREKENAKLPEAFRAVIAKTANRLQLGGGNE